MNPMDFSCFTGNWPFHKVRCNTVEALTRQHRRCGITGGYISAFEAIFYQDPYEVEKCLAEELAGTSYRHALVLNPTLPVWQADLHRAVEELQIQAVRLIPAYHGYSLTDPVMEQVMETLQAYNLPLILTYQLEDPRSAWMFRPRAVEPAELTAFLDNFPQVTTVLSNVRVSMLKYLAPQFQTRRNLFSDTAGFRSGMFPVEEAWPITGGQLVFGTNAPLAPMASVYQIVDKAAVSGSIKDTIFSGTPFLKELKTHDYLGDVYL